MLTKTMESRQAKSGYYWRDGRYGPIHLQLVKQEGGTEAERFEETLDGQQPAQGFDFGMSEETKARRARHAKADMARQLGVLVDEVPQGWSDSDSPSDDDDDSIIRREFLLWHESDPSLKRTVIQFQYVGWPDSSVPTSPTNLLKLISEINVDYAEYQATGIVGQDQKDEPNQKTTSRGRTSSHLLHRGPAIEETAPNRSISEVLVHCSAGVGRTGSFILVDAILDAIRRKLQQSTTSPEKSEDPISTCEEYHRSGAYPLSTDVASEALPQDGPADPFLPKAAPELEVVDPVYRIGAAYASRSVGSIPELEGLSMQSTLPVHLAPTPDPFSIQPSMQPNVIPTLFSPVQTPAATTETQPTNSLFTSQPESFPSRDLDYFRDVSSRATQVTDSSRSKCTAAGMTRQEIDE